MLIGADRNTSTARLFAVLALGERLAEEGARQQLALTGRSDMQRFLRRQAVQERLHRVVFEKAAAAIAPRGGGASRAYQPFAAFARLLEDAWQRRDLAETLLAQQVILEGLGDMVLECLDAGMTARGFGLQALRRTLRRQEHAHHQFGLRRLDELRGRGYIDMNVLRRRTCDYLDACDQALEQLADLFARFDEDAGTYRRRLHDAVPQWLQPPGFMLPTA
ncbi:MAG: hypothetical protein ACT4NU_05205 [Chromatiales bacterium]